MTITKRNGKFYCRFQINGERRHKLCAGAKTVKEAVQIENAFKYKLLQQQNGILPKEKKEKKLEDLIRIYLTYSKINKKSHAHDISRVKKIKDFFKNKKYIDEIKPNDIEKFKDALLERNLSKASVNHYLTVLQKMYNIAINNEWTDKNPVKKGAKFPKRNYVVRYLTKEEERKIFEACPGHFKPVVEFALNTGLRLSNIINLKKENIDFNIRQIIITENKGNKFGVVYMNEKVTEILKSATTGGGGHIFLNPNTGRPYSKSAVHRLWTKIKKEAGVENFRFHDLRHTVATRLVEKGVPVPVVKELMWHSNVETTMRYVHAVAEQIKGAMSVLDSYS